MMIKRIIVAFLWVITLQNILFAQPVQICLLVNETKPKFKELLHDFLGWQLLMMPDVELIDCEKNIFQHHHYRLRQEIREIHREAKKRYQVVLALYDSHKRTLLSQIELIDTMQRQAMLKRASALAYIIRKKIEQNEAVQDPFEQINVSIPSITEHVTGHSQLTFISHAQEKRLIETGLLLGFQQIGRKSSLTGKKILTSYFPVAGLGLDIRAANFLTIATTIQGTVFPIEFEQASVIKTKNLIKLFALEQEILFELFSNDFFKWQAGLSLRASYLNLSQEIFYGASLFNSSWQLEGGFLGQGIIFIDALSINIGLRGGYLPLVHNFSLEQNKPFTNFSWFFGVHLESMLMKALALRLSWIMHAHELSVSSLSKERIVGHESLAYLALIINI